MVKQARLPFLSIEPEPAAFDRFGYTVRDPMPADGVSARYHGSQSTQFTLMGSGRPMATSVHLSAATPE
jgi:hypothetical protein